MTEGLRERLKDAAGDSAELADLLDSFRDQELLISIGRSLAAEHDTDKLLRLILAVSKEITGADAGSIFLVETTGESDLLRFKYSHTFSKQLDYEEFTMPRTASSIAGYVSLTGDILSIDDVYYLPMELPYRFNMGFDTAFGYRTKSMLVIPMKNNRDEIIGVIQLINSKEDEASQVAGGSDTILLSTPEDFDTKVVPFRRRYVGLMEAVANQAAIALENSRMIKQIREQFESFVKAAVFAVESRDPATSGHSERVAALAKALMRAVTEDKNGEYADRDFDENDLQEIEYSGLLHDFGKVYIDPQVFLKAKKLYPRDYDFLMMRLKYLAKSLELGYERLLSGAERAANAGELEELRRKRADQTRDLLEVMDIVAVLNEPKPTDSDPAEAVAKARGVALPDFCADLDGKPLPVLTNEEAENLSIRKGSLNAAERALIQEHVTFTYQFVSKIPWPPEYDDIPEYCYKHHEMLDGSGYPRGLGADDLPLQARMLAVADVYDALSARDRPYKKALPPEIVKKILLEEAANGRLDAELVRLFYERNVFQAIS